MQPEPFDNEADTQSPVTERQRKLSIDELILCVIKGKVTPYNIGGMVQATALTLAYGSTPQEMLHNQA